MCTHLVPFLHFFDIRTVSIISHNKSYLIKEMSFYEKTVNFLHINFKSHYIGYDKQNTSYKLSNIPERQGLHTIFGSVLIANSDQRLIGWCLVKNNVVVANIFKVMIKTKHNSRRTNIDKIFMETKHDSGRTTSSHCIGVSTGKLALIYVIFR